jgi:hypothetical protein
MPKSYDDYMNDDNNLLMGEGTFSNVASFVNKENALILHKLFSAMKDGQKIDAIRYARDLCGKDENGNSVLPLKEAKDLVESVMNKEQPSKGSLFVIHSRSGDPHDITSSMGGSMQECERDVEWIMDSYHDAFNIRICRIVAEVQEEKVVTKKLVKF